MLTTRQLDRIPVQLAYNNSVEKHLARTASRATWPRNPWLHFSERANEERRNSFGPRLSVLRNVQTVRQYCTNGQRGSGSSSICPWLLFRQRNRTCTPSRIAFDVLDSALQVYKLLVPAKRFDETLPRYTQVVMRPLALTVLCSFPRWTDWPTVGSTSKCTTYYLVTCEDFVIGPGPTVKGPVGVRLLCHANVPPKWLIEKLTNKTLPRGAAAPTSPS